MTRVGGFVVGTGVKVGRTGLTTPQQHQFDAVAGVSPSYPGRTVPMRVRCAEIWSFDPLTWAPVAKLPNVSTVGATRAATLVEPGFQQETLTFTLLDANTTLVAGTWLCVKWTVTVAGASTSHLGGVFRVVPAASRTRQGVATTQQVQAIDWFQYDASIIDGAGSVAFSTLRRWRDAYAASALPQFTDAFSFIPDDASAIGNVLAGAILERATTWTGSVVPLRVMPWATLADPFLNVDVDGTGDLLTPAALDVGNAGSPTTFYDTLRKLWLLTGGFTLAYDIDGYLLLMPGGDRAASSGAYITCDGTPLGAIPLPWATPLQRNLTRPEYDTVSYFVRRDPAPTEALGDTVGTLANPARVESFASVHPLGSSSKGTEEVVDTIPWFGADINHTYQAIGFESDLAWCRYRLRQHLAAADTVSFGVDPAYPPPPCGRLVRIGLAPDVAGDYQGSGFNQPLTAQLGSYTLRWWEDR